MMRPIKALRKWSELLQSVKTFERRFSNLERNMKNLINSSYNHLNDALSYKAKLAEKEYGIFSQNGEDGLLLYIFSEIGIENKTCIEFGIGDGRQCNSANLIINFGWKSLMIEGNPDSSKKAFDFYSNHHKISSGQVTVKNAFITKDNINDLFLDGGVQGEIDLLSIDIDGNDYWVWDAITSVNPRVIIVEYNPTFGPEKSVSVEYDPDFYRFDKHESGWYYGASLTAFTELGKSKGYKLIGCDTRGVNAFFIRNDVHLKTLQECTPKEAYYEDLKRSQISTIDKQFNLIKHLPLVEV